MDVRNKVIIISGASSGIGKSLAQLLSSKNAKVVLLARREEKLIEIEGELNNAGVGYFGTIEKLPMEEFDRLVKTNVYGMLHLS